MRYMRCPYDRVEADERNNNGSRSVQRARIGLLSVGEVCELFGLSPDAVRRWSPDELPFVRVGPRRDRRYAIEDVVDYLARRSVGRTSIGGDRDPDLSEMFFALGRAEMLAAAAGERHTVTRLRRIRVIVARSVSKRDSG